MSDMHDEVLDVCQTYMLKSCLTYMMKSYMSVRTDLHVEVLDVCQNKTTMTSTCQKISLACKTKSYMSDLHVGLT